MNLYIITFACKNHTLLANVRANNVKDALVKAIKSTFNRTTNYKLVQLTADDGNIFTQDENTVLVKSAESKIEGYYRIEGFLVA